MLRSTFIDRTAGELVSIYTDITVARHQRVCAIGRSLDHAAISRSRINRLIVNLPFCALAAQPSYLRYRLDLISYIPVNHVRNCVGIKIHILEHGKCAKCV